MKRKNIIIIALALFAIKCSKLKEKPYGFYSEDNFYKTEKDANAAVLYAYDALTSIEYSRGIFYIGELPTNSVGIKADENVAYHALNDWTIIPDNTTLTQYFKSAYIGINRANAVIDNVPKGDYSQESKNKFIGEGYFLRAWNYFNLARVFGEVPLQTGMVNSLEETTPPMGSLEEIYSLIINDLRKAIKLLDIQRQLGRADQVAAQALLAKVYTTMASSKQTGVENFDFVTNTEAMYDSAVVYAEKVINRQTEYTLSDDLLSIYDVEQPRGNEHIFIMSMHRSGTEEGDYSKISKLFIPWADASVFYVPNVAGTPNASQLTKTHNGWEVFPTEDEFYKSFDNDDLRKKLLIVSEVYDENANLLYSVGEGTLRYPFTRKYIDPLFEGEKTSTRPFLIRFSDIALIYAEALGATTEAYTQINAIRNRAGLDNLETGLNNADFRHAVRQERIWELAFEGQYLFELRRTNRINEVLNVSSQYAYFYPIPQKELDLNPNL